MLKVMLLKLLMEWFGLGVGRLDHAGGELAVSSEPQNAISKYGLLFSGVLIAPAAAIFYLEKKKRRVL